MKHTTQLILAPITIGAIGLAWSLLPGGLDNAPSSAVPATDYLAEAPQDRDVELQSSVPQAAGAEESTVWIRESLAERHPAPESDLLRTVTIVRNDDPWKGFFGDVDSDQLKKDKRALKWEILKDTRLRDAHREIMVNGGGEVIAKGLGYNFVEAPVGSITELAAHHTNKQGDVVRTVLPREDFPEAYEKLDRLNAMHMELLRRKIRREGR